MFSLVLLGAGSTYAATNPEAILGSQSEVRSADNSFIINLDVSAFNPELKVTEVKEDADSYYVAYEYHTVAPVDYVWQPALKTGSMVVSKRELEGKDLGLFVSKQLSQIVTSETTYLAGVQQRERSQGASAKVVATQYSGLVGRFLSPTEETFEGYVPVIAPESQVAAAASAGGCQADCVGSQPGGASPGSSSTATPAPSGPSSLTLQVLGNNPAEVPTGSTYSDLGALLVYPQNPNLGYYIFYNGKQTSNPRIDTSVPGRHEIEYRATDMEGRQVVAVRTVVVGGGEPAPTPVEETPPAPEPALEAPVSEALTPETPVEE